MEKKWNGMGYYANEIDYEIKDGKGLIKEHNIEDESLFIWEYLNGEISGKVELDGKYGLLFKGYYLNGKRHGKGKEYLYDKLIFEGEYFNGEKNGKGKEYYEEGILIFEGEYLNGKKWNGKGYNKNGDI